ncbi:unnamed protein product [Heligmosomoides polygyrus]|uniref:Transposase n=1 Tax=Heligmosomoides polygyrus TaxID=6339 RepID=A0A3P8EJU6_HELPZ|nr:unnamed protein product [Heligmosomoides polygyrus]
MAGVTRLDRIRNEAIRQKFGVTPIADKMREARLRWYGHVLRGKEDSVRKMGLELEVLGKRPRGRPKQRWTTVSPLLTPEGCGAMKGTHLLDSGTQKRAQTPFYQAGGG